MPDLRKVVNKMSTRRGQRYRIKRPSALFLLRSQRDLTPEERWIKIENAIQALVAAQAHHDVEIAENRRQIAAVAAENSKQIEKISREIEKTSRENEKNTAAIRDLIAISRTLIDSQRDLKDTQQARDKEIKELRLNLNALIETVNSFVKSLRKPNGDR